MKKLAVLVLLVLVAAPLSAANEISDMLLSSTGTLYTISSEKPAADSASQATEYLVLTERRGEETKREIVKPSDVRGTHLNSLLGYDAESGTLFVFWIQHFGFLYNQLLFATRDSNGNWSEASTFGSPYNYRENLRIAVTRKVADPRGLQPTDGLTVHATWWEFDSRTGRQAAQYRMLPIVDGRVVDASELNLDEFLPYTLDTNNPDADPTVLKHPLLQTSPQQDSVSLVFGNLHSGSFSKVRITPTRGVVVEGRIRIPVGKREGGFKAPQIGVSADARLEGVFGDHGQTALYTLSPSMLQYVMLGAEGWSEPHTVTLDEQITGSAAVSALHRMVAEQ
jgi:hypothetical protein